MSPRTTTRACDSRSTVASVSNSGSSESTSPMRPRLVRGSYENAVEAKKTRTNAPSGRARRFGTSGARAGDRSRASPLKRTKSAATADSPMKTFESASAPTVHS